MANWFLGRALAEEAEAEKRAVVVPWRGRGVLGHGGGAAGRWRGGVPRHPQKEQQEVLLDGKDDGSRRNVHGAVVRAEPHQALVDVDGRVGDPASMLPLLLFAYCYGVGPGMVLGALYGVMQFLLDGMAWAALGAIPNLLDYPIAFGLLGLAGCFPRQQGEDDSGLRAGLLRAVYGVVPLRLHLLWAVRA